MMQLKPRPLPDCRKPVVVTTTDRLPRRGPPIRPLVAAMMTLALLGGCATGAPAPVATVVPVAPQAPVALPPAPPPVAAAPVVTPPKPARPAPPRVVEPPRAEPEPEDYQANVASVVRPMSGHRDVTLRVSFAGTENTLSEPERKKLLEVIDAAAKNPADLRVRIVFGTEGAGDRMRASALARQRGLAIEAELPPALRPAEKVFRPGQSASQLIVEFHDLSDG